MSVELDLQILARAPLLSLLSEAELRHLAFGAEPLNAAEGRWLYRADQRCDGAYVLVSGAIGLVTDEAANTVDSRFDEPGTMFGEAGLVTETRWRSSALIEQPSRLLRIPRALFRRVLDEYPQSATTLQAYFAKRIDETVRAVSPIARKL